MSDKSAPKTATPPMSRRNTGTEYDLFDSLRQARLKAKQSRQKRQSPADEQPEGDARHDGE